MLSKRYLLFIIISITILNGCAYTPQTVHIKPHLVISKSNLGRGKEVFVKVIDERDDLVIGYRGDASVDRGGEITTEQDIVGIVRAEIMRVMRKKGFKPILSGESKRNLEVELRLFKYYTSTGFWTGGVHTKTTFKIIAKNRDETYENIYRTSKQKRIFFVPDAKSNEEQINKTLTEGMKKIFRDDKLFEFLAKE